MTDGTELQDCVALVVGGARGIGRGITDRLVAAGAVVTVSDQDRADDLPAEVAFVVADVRQPAQAERLVASVVDQHGRLDLVVNALGPAGPEATAVDVVAVELLGPLHVSTAANEAMQAHEAGGVIVNLGSVGGMVPSPQSPASGAAKAGLVSLTQSHAAAWGPRVRVNCVSIGPVADGPADGGDEPVTTVPLGRLGSAEDVADAVLWLASPASAYVSGANLVLHGGGRRPAFLAAITGP